MDELFTTVGYLLNRYVHIVAMTLLVGGTLFYEMVLPLAIGEMKNEQQLAVFARARLVFRWIVLTCAAAILLSGIISMYGNWNAYSRDESAPFRALVETAKSVKVEGLAPWQHPRTWVIAHGVLGAIGLALAASLVISNRPPDKPIRWMRLNLMLLLITIFLGSATRNARLRLFETLDAIAQQPMQTIRPANSPATTDSTQE